VVDEIKKWLRAIAQQPESDLPRLVFADWLEELGETEWARGVRLQVAAADQPSWSEEAIRAEYFGHIPDTYYPPHYPMLDSRTAVWDSHMDRGICASIVVRNVYAFLEVADELFEAVPITSMSLPTSDRMTWQEFTRRPWLRQVQRIEFYGISTPIEAVRVFAESEALPALGEICFQRTSGDAMPAVLEHLARSPLGRQLKAMELASGDFNQDWAESFDEFGDAHRLESLVFTRFALRDEGWDQLCQSTLLARLKRLRFVMCRFNTALFNRLMSSPLTQIHELGLARCEIEDLRSVGRLTQTVKHLDLSGSVWRGKVPNWGSKCRLEQLHVLSLAKARFSGRPVFYDAGLWSGLQAIDLALSSWSETDRLLEMPPMPNLIAIRLPPTRDSITSDLRDRFGDLVAPTPEMRRDPE
jgi:uncharacterized protein (TIGR02996 family)